MTNWLRATAIALLIAILGAILFTPPDLTTSAAPSRWTIIDDNTVDPLAWPPYFPR